MSTCSRKRVSVAVDGVRRLQACCISLALDHLMGGSGVAPVSSRNARPARNASSSSSSESLPLPSPAGPESANTKPLGSPSGTRVGDLPAAEALVSSVRLGSEAFAGREPLTPSTEKEIAVPAAIALPVPSRVTVSVGQIEPPNVMATACVCFGA